MRAPAALALALAAGCGGGGKATSSTAPAASACVTYAEAQAEEKAVAERNEAHLQRALAEQGLREPAFAADYFDARGREDGDTWQLVEAAGARTLLAPESYLVCGVSNPWRLAEDGAGGVSALMITSRETASKVVTICGCRADVPITCGGAAPQPVRWRWAMSPSSTWKGPLAIVVDHESMTTAFAGRADGSPCPTPTAPP